MDSESHLGSSCVPANTSYLYFSNLQNGIMIFNSEGPFVVKVHVECLSLRYLL